MTHEHEAQLLEATVAVTRIVLQLTSSKKGERMALTDRHKRMLLASSENFEQASRLLAELVEVSAS